MPRAWVLAVRAASASAGFDLGTRWELRWDGSTAEIYFGAAQGNRRTIACQEFAKALREAGWDASIHYAMD